MPTERHRFTLIEHMRTYLEDYITEGHTTITITDCDKDYWFDNIYQHFKAPIEKTPFQKRMEEKKRKRDEVIRQSEIKHKVTLTRISI